MLTIGRLGSLAGLEPKTLRYYDRVGLVQPASRTPTGYRLYTAEAVDRLHFIASAKTLGMSLADIRRILAVRDEGAAPCQHVMKIVARNLTKVEEQIAQLDRLKGDLHRLQRRLKEQVTVNARSVEDCACFTLIESFHKPRTLNTRRLSHGRQGGRYD
jgi:MerR family Zn(II)-responsive transcriptional regulator of zntA